MGGLTYFLYDGEQPVCEMNGSGSVSAFGPNGLAGRTAGGVNYEYAWDASGNVAQRYGTNGGGVYSAWDGFGYPMARTDYGGAPGEGDPFSGFGGQWGGYTDAETGLTLFTHRYYDWVTGRFLTRDPMGYDGGVNLYGYTQNDPVNASDASGLMAAEPGCKEAAIVNAAIKLACMMINTAPISTNGNGIGITPSEKKCLQNLCRSNMTIRCGSPRCKQRKDPILGNHYPGFFGPGTITICTGRDGNPSQFEPGVGSATQNIALILIHEMLHECGRDDNGGPKLPGTPNSPSNPADDGARSCMHLGPPYKEGYNN